MQLVPGLLCEPRFSSIETSEPASDVVARHGFVRTFSKCGERRQCVLRSSGIRREVLETVGLSGAQQDQSRCSQFPFDGGRRTAVLCISRFGILKGTIGRRGVVRIFGERNGSRTCLSERELSCFDSAWAYGVRQRSYRSVQDGAINYEDEGISCSVIFASRPVPH